MKHGLRNVLMISFLAVAGIFGVTSTLINKQVEETPVVEKAEATSYSGSIAIEFQNGYGGWFWDNDNAKVAIYVFTGDVEVGWTSMISTTAGTHRYEIPYSFSRSPMGCTMHLVRYPNNHSDTPDWNNSNWGRLDNQSFGNVVYCWATGANIQVTAYPFIGTNSMGWTRNDSNILRYAHFNGSNVELYGNVTLQQGDWFKFLYDNGDTTYNTINSGVDSTYIKGSPYYPYNIDCFYFGTYTFYVKHTYDNKEMYIDIPDRAKAEHWGDTFLKTVTCTGTSPGAVTSATTAWTETMAGAYDALTTDQQGEIWKLAANPSGTYLEQAVYRYDFIIHKYGTGTYSDFVGRTNSGGGYAMGAVKSFSPFTLLSSEEDNLSTIIIITASSIALISIASLSILIIKKKKSKEE